MLLPSWWKSDKPWIIADCLEVMKGMPDKCVDLVLTDLPYGMVKCAWDKKLDLSIMWSEIKRIRKSVAALVFTSSQPFTTDLINSNREEFRYEYIWIKNRPSSFVNAHKLPMKQHESILVFYDKLPTYNPQMQKRAESGSARRKTPIKASTISKCFEIKTEDRRIPKLKLPSSVLKYNTEVGLHPTQKPIELFKFLIQTYTEPEGIVFDLCLGSGTTLEASRNTGRIGLGCEINPDYEPIIAKRSMQNIAKLDYFGGIE